MRVIVLKLGGSVLAGEASLPAAVHEVYRWRRAGWRVVAVVSAFAGATDRLVARARALDASPWSVAAAAACGEHLAAALLAAHLDRAGVPAAVLSPAALALRAAGDPLEATPASLDRAPLHAALERYGVAVVPGFAAVDAAGRTVLFGRGGSDLSALFLAAELGARCRLLKDVDGLYESDPALPGPAPRRFAAAGWDDALAVGGAVLQQRAVRFARERGLAFEVAALGARGATRIGSGPARFDRGRARPAPAGTVTSPTASAAAAGAMGSGEECAPASARGAPPAVGGGVPGRSGGGPVRGSTQDRGRASDPLRVALLGLGTVGGGVWRLAREHPGLDVVVACNRDAARARALGVPRERWSDDPRAAARAEVDVVVECLGGREPALSALASALGAGRDVVTANKLVVAAHGDMLRALAREHGARLACSAAVGGSAPMLEALEALARLRRRVARVRGVLNGTTNFVLEALAEGAELEDALAAARARGLAEADATRDLDGRDAADKLCVIAGVLGLGAVHVEREPLPADLAARARRAADAGHRLRQVAELEPAGRRTPHVGAARPRATVRLVALAPDDPLFALPGAANAALLADAAGRVERVHGVGAGRWPTAEAVLGDLLALARARRRSPAPHLRAPVATLERSPSPLHGTSSCSPSP